MNKIKRIFITTSIMFMIIILSACGSSSTPSSDEEKKRKQTTTNLKSDYDVALTAITVELTSATVTSGNSITATAFGDYDNGIRNEPLNYVSWFPTGDYTIDSNGVITAGDVSTTTTVSLIASYEGVGKFVEFTIEPLPIIPVVSTLSSISLLPTTFSALNQGESIQLSAIGTYSDGSNKNLTDTTTWVSADASIVGVTAGIITAGTIAGTTAISATTNGMTVSTNVQALAALASIQLSAPTTIVVGQPVIIQATGSYTDGTTQNINNSVTWASSNTLSISTTQSGHITVGNDEGASDISVTLNNITASANIYFTAPTRIEINTVVNSLAPNSNTILKATAINSATNFADISNRVTWVVEDTSIASINTDSATKISTLNTKSIIANTNLTATAFGLSAQKSLKVVLNGNAPIIKLRFSDNSISTLVGKQYLPTLISTDVNNIESVVTDTNIAWKSSNPSVATVTNTGLITSQFITKETDVTNIAATYKGVNAKMFVYVAQPQVYDYFNYTVDTNLEITQVESTLFALYANISSAPSMSGVLADIPIKVLNPGYYFLTSDNPLTSDQIAIGINNNISGTYNKQSASFIFVKDKTNPQFYALDATANTSLSLTVNTYGNIGEKTTGSFTAKLCRNDAINAGTCAMPGNTIDLVGNYAVTVDAEKDSTCYTATEPKLINSYVANANQLICNGAVKSYYQLATNIGVTYEITATSPEAITIVAEGGTPVTGMTTFEATKSMSEIAFSYAGASNFHSFKLTVAQQAAGPQGSQANPASLTDVIIPIDGTLSVDATTSYYKIAAKIGHRYISQFTVSDISGTPTELVVSISDNNIFTDPATVCNNLTAGCTVTATENFIYIKLKGPTNGGATLVLSQKYKSDEFLDLFMPIVNYRGQVGDTPGGTNGPQGSNYWVDGLSLKSNTDYIIKLDNVENVTQLWINNRFIGQPGLQKGCKAGGGGNISPSIQCIIKTDNSFPSAMVGIPINVIVTHALGSSYSISMSEVSATQNIYYVSTYANNLTGNANDGELTRIELFRANATLPFYNTLNDQVPFDSVAFDVVSGETIDIKITDPKLTGDYYSIIVNTTGDTVKSTASPASPDIFEPNDNNRANATNLILDTGSDHSMLNGDGSLNDFDWFKFTAP